MATVSIQVPMLETKLPVQMVAKARCRNGRNGDTRVGWAGLVTGPGYPGRPGPAGALLGVLLQGGPEGVVGLGGAPEAAGALGEHRPGGDRAAGAARGGEHADRPGERRRADRLPGRADGEVEEPVVVEVVQEEPAGDGGPELVAVLGVGLGHQGPAARAGRRPGQQVDRPGLGVRPEVLAGGADGQVPLADAVAVGRRHRGPELVEALGVPGSPAVPWNSSRSLARPPGGPLKTLTAPASWRPLTVSPGAPATTSSPAVSSKSPVATAAPNRSRGSGLPWVATAPAARPPGEPASRLTAPALEVAPTFSPGAPTTRSAMPSPPRMPLATAEPKASPVSAAPPAPPPWNRVWLPAAVSLAGEPYRTVTAPALPAAPMSSPGAPTARSKTPSPSKSPLATAEPNRSPSSRLPPTPPLPWKNTSGLASSPLAEL